MGHEQQSGAGLANEEEPLVVAEEIEKLKRQIQEAHDARDADILDRLAHENPAELLLIEIARNRHARPGTLRFLAGVVIEGPAEWYSGLKAEIVNDFRLPLETRSQLEEL